MPGPIQSIERAAAVLRILAEGSGPLRLSEVSVSLGLPRSTVHGLLATLAEVGAVVQDRATGRYRLSDGLERLRPCPLDGNELRALGMNWADPLAARSEESVRMGILEGAEVLVVHHVLRPDPAPQRAEVGMRIPAHATALGKVLLSHHPALTDVLVSGGLTSYTARTATDGGALLHDLRLTRNRGYAVEFGEHLPERASIAAPVLEPGGRTVGSVGIHGHLDRICDPSGVPRPRLVDQVVECGRAVSRQLATDRSA